MNRHEQLRNLSIDEMADFLFDTFFDTFDCIYCPLRNCTQKNESHCREAIIDWLKLEVEED